MPNELPFLGIGLMELGRHQCKYPDNSEPYLFCGQPTDRSYCEYHHRVAYCPITPGKRVPYAKA